MDPDRVTGKAKETFGKVEAGVGDALGDTHTEASGRIRQASGAAENLYGQAKDTAKDMAGDAVGQAKDAVGQAKDAYGQARDAVGDRFGDTFGDTLADAGKTAEDALHSIEREVKARPLMALLIAALIGFVLAQLTTR